MGSPPATLHVQHPDARALRAALHMRAGSSAPHAAGRARNWLAPDLAHARACEQSLRAHATSTHEAARRPWADLPQMHRGQAAMQCTQPAGQPTTNLNA